MSTRTPTDDPEIYAVMDQLAAGRRALRLSQAAAAAQLGVSRSSLSRFERCVETPRISVLQSYARLVGLSLHFVVTELPPALELDLYAPTVVVNDATRLVIAS